MLAQAVDTRQASTGILLVSVLMLRELEAARESIADLQSEGMTAMHQAADAHRVS